MQLPGQALIVDPFHRKRILILSFLTVVTFGVIIEGFIIGMTAVISPLLYLPVIIVAYWYPRQGLVFSIGVAVVYGFLLFFYPSQDTIDGLVTLSRIALLIMIGGVVSYLSWNLSKYERQLMGIIEFLPDATFAIDREGRILAWNRAIEVMTGRSKSAMLNRGNYEYALAFYDERRPMMAGLIISNGKHIDERYPQIRENAGVLVSEVYLPHFQGGRGAHLRFSATALVDVNGNIIGAIESIRDITDQVMTKSALEKTGHRLNTLAGILRHDMSRRLAALYGQLRFGVMKFQDPDVISFIADLKESANGITRQIDISREFRDLGATPPAWMYVQDTIDLAATRLDFGKVIFHVWTERLCVFSDPQLTSVFYHLLHNALKETTGAIKILITYQIRETGCAIIIEDNGAGIPDSEKSSLFVQRENSYGSGLFLSSEIVSLTGMTLRETGVYGNGARFEITVPSEGYRLNEVECVKTLDSTQPVSGFELIPHDNIHRIDSEEVSVRELPVKEFGLADEIWKDYHETKGDPTQDRIFAVFLGKTPVSLARCRRHSDGIEVDGIFTLENYRGKKYSRRAVGALVEACHNDDLFMYAVRHLVTFYATFGFVPINEMELPPVIRERYTWAAGNLEGAEVQPMRRGAGL
jgi:PAS domain S-box-containing protein